MNIKFLFENLHIQKQGHSQWYKSQKLIKIWLKGVKFSIFNFQHFKDEKSIQSSNNHQKIKFSLLMFVLGVYLETIVQSSCISLSKYMC